MNAVEIKFGSVPHGLEILRPSAGFENRTGAGGFVKGLLVEPDDGKATTIYTALIKTLRDDHGQLAKYKQLSCFWIIWRSSYGWM